MRRREKMFVPSSKLKSLLDYGHSWCLLCGIFFFLQKGKEEDTQELDSEDCFFDRSIFHLLVNDEELEENNPPDFPVVHVEVVQMENKSI
jgi:hypothetical protein